MQLEAATHLSPALVPYSNQRISPPGFICALSSRRELLSVNQSSKVYCPVDLASPSRVPEHALTDRSSPPSPSDLRADRKSVESHKDPPVLRKTLPFPHKRAFSQVDGPPYSHVPRMTGLHRLRVRRAHNLLLNRDCRWPRRQHPPKCAN